MRDFDVISASDYQGLGGGWGMITASELEDLNKALKTGSGIVGEHAETELSPLRVQSLENTVKTLVHRQEHLVLWNSIPKSPAYSTTEEYTVLKGYGEDAGDGFIGEVATPIETKQSYRREVALVKYLGVKKETSLVATLVRNMVDVEAEQVRIGTLELLSMVERALLFANNQCNSSAWPGFFQQIDEWVHGVNLDGSTYAHSEDAELIIDCEGEPLTEERLEEACQKVADRYGRLTDLYLSYKAQSDLVKQLFPKERYPHPPITQDGAAGVPLKRFNSATGPLELRPSVFLRSNRGLTPRSTSQDASIGQISASQVTLAAGSSSVSKMEAGTYYYFVSKLGFSATSGAYGLEGAYQGTHAQASVTPTAGQKVTVTVPAAEINGSNIEGVRIYRGTSSSASSARWVADVPKGKKLDENGLLSTLTGDDAGKVVFEDANRVRPNTTEAFAVDNDPDQVWRFRQLAPVMRMPLAITATAKPFMILLFGVPILYNPRRAVWFRNIGDAGL